MSKISDAQEAIEKNIAEYFKLSSDDVLQQRGKAAQEWKKEYEQNILSERFATQCDVLILTANQVETNTFLRLVSDDGKNPVITTIIDNYRCHMCQIAETNVVHIQTLDTGADTKYGSRHATEFGIKFFQPKLVVSLGVAFGNDPNFQNLGDVIISEVLCCYSEKNKLTNNGISLKPERFHCIAPLLLNAWGNPLSNKSYPMAQGKAFMWHLGTVLSGASVVDSLRKKLSLIRACKNNNYDNVVGGEMEGYGAFDVCNNKSSIPFIVVKGICDWAADKNIWDISAKKAGKAEPIGLNTSWNDFLKDGVQGLATENAFHALELLLEFGKVPLIDDRNNCAIAVENDVTPSNNNNSGIMSSLKNISRETIIILVLWTNSFVGYFAQLLRKFDLPSQHRMASMFTLCFFIVAIIYTIYVLYIKYLFEPFQINIEVAEINICGLSFKKCECTIKNMSKYVLKNFRATWINKKQKALACNSSCFDEVKSERITINYLSANKSNEKYKCPFCGTVQPDTVQFEYDLNGNRIYHVIRGGYIVNWQKTGPVKHFCEHIYLLKNDKYILLYKRKHVDKFANEKFSLS